MKLILKEELKKEIKGLEEPSHFLLFLDKHFKVLVDDGHSKQDTRATPNSTWKEGEVT